MFSREGVTDYLSLNVMGINNAIIPFSPLGGKGISVMTFPSLSIVIKSNASCVDTISVFLCKFVTQKTI